MKTLRPLYLLIIILLPSCGGDDLVNDVQSLPLSASFASDLQTVKPGESVTFSDRTTGGATKWDWVFEGGVPQTSTDQNPVVRYDSPGTYNVSLTVMNARSYVDTHVINDFITVKDPLSPTREFEASIQTTFGVSLTQDKMQSMVILDDGSIVCVGSTDKENPATSTLNMLIAKFDNNLNLQWHKEIGGSGVEVARDIIPTNDGGLLLTGTTESDDGDIANNHGSVDVAIAKLRANGEVQWLKTYGGSGYDGIGVHSLIKRENGYAFIGFLDSDDANIAGRIGMRDIWLTEIDDNGNTTNTFAIGSTADDLPASFIGLDNGNYVILGSIGAASDAFEQPGIWLFAVNASGEVVWKQFIDGVAAGDVIKTQDGGYLTLNSRNNNQTPDLLATKFNSQGVQQWEKLYPLSTGEVPQNVIEIDNAYIILGFSFSYSGPQIQNAYVAKINQSGDVIQWKTFGTNAMATKIFEVNDEKYILGGSQSSGPNSQFWLQYIMDYW